MSSTLLLSSPESLQRVINQTIANNSPSLIIYVSLNKVKEDVLRSLSNSGIDYTSLFFISCLSTQSEKLPFSISPSNLEDLQYVLLSFLKELPKNTVIIIDSLASLLIYNSENLVVRFVKSITELSSTYNARFFAFSQKTNEEELLNKVFNFFEEVKR